MVLARYKPWDIVKVPFPFTEGIGEKRRPALIVSSPSLGESHRLYWLMMITSVIKPAWKGDVVIQDLARTGLPVTSIIRTTKITTLQEDRILGKIGTLGTEEKRQVARFMENWLA